MGHDDRQHRPDGHGRLDGVSAPFEDRPAGFRCQRVGTDDHARSRGVAKF